VKAGDQTKPAVVFIAASVGAGHNAAARAVSAALARIAPDTPTRTLDSMDFVPAWYRSFYAGGFELAVVRTPGLYGAGFRLTDLPQRPRRSPSEWLRLAMEWRVLGRLRKELASLQPQLIIHTHFLAPSVVGSMISRGQLAGRQWIVATDRKLHRFWYAENVDRYFVAGDRAAETLSRWKVPNDRVTVSDIPVHPKWTQRIDRDEALRTWQLPPGKRLILVSGGATYTTGPILQTARSLARGCPDAMICVLCGSNRRLLRQVGAHGMANLRGIKMTDRVQELAGACSVMVTKPGGILTAECAAQGVPMVLPRPIPGQELGNARFFARRGAALVLRRWGQVPGAVRRLLDDPQRLTTMSQAAQAVHVRAADLIANAIVETLA